MSSGRQLYTTPDRTRHFLIPEDADLPDGDLLLKTFGGGERAVDAGAVAEFEVDEAEAREWAKSQLGDVFGEMREKVQGFADRLKGRTAELREENRKAWEEARTDPELREATDRIRGGLKEIGRALQKLAKDGMERTEAEQAAATDTGVAGDVAPDTSEAGPADDPGGAEDAPPAPPEGGRTT